MKRIAILTNSIFTCGGEQRVVCILANALSQSHEVTIYTEDSPTTKDNPYNLSPTVHIEYFHPFATNIIIKGFRFLFKIPGLNLLRTFPWTWKLTHYNKGLAKKLRDTLQGKYDSVIAVSDRLSLLLGFTKQVGLQTKVLAWEHNSFEAYFRTKNHRLWKQDALFINAAKYFDHCVVLNEDYAEKYKKHLGIECDVIYNPKSFVSTEKARLLNHTIICCCVLDIEPKGLDLLIESFDLFIRNTKDWKLRIIGDGTDKEKLEQMVKERNIQANVEFLGYRKDIRELLLDAAIFVLPSRWEGFSMSLTEAYECGLPTVAYDIPALIPFKRQNACIVCEPFNVQEYAKALQKLASSLELRQEYAKKTQAFAEQISIENITKKWIEIL